MIDETAKQASREDTNLHRRLVAAYLAEIAFRLGERAVTHDASKLEEPELSAFATYGPRLKNMTYGSEEYRAALREMKPAVQHHYEANRHHPEHFPEGIAQMDLIDLIEMVCDWRAACKRMAADDFGASMKINEERFGLPPKLTAIILNTKELR